MLDPTKIPKGAQSFNKLREAGQIYVDKTDMIFEIAQFDGTFFLARPRRFGKTLLVSTFASLFEHGLRDFQGLKIASLWKDKNYEVIDLNFSLVVDFSSVESFKRKFFAYLSICLEPHGFVASGDPERFVFEFGRWLRSHDNHSLVLLIDEYDALLTSVLHDRELFDGVQSVLRELFNWIKAASSVFRFVFITGITRFSHTSIFSGFNNLTDLSLDPKYGTLIGSTEEELQSYFGEYLKDAADACQVTVPKLIYRLKTYYDGFCFDKDGSTHVFCPWSILCFLFNRNYTFENFWFESGGQPNVLMNYLALRKLKAPFNFSEPVSLNPNQLLSSRPYDQLDVDVLLHQTGYLTIRSVTQGGLLTLGYPNREVEASMAQLYVQMMTDEDDRDVDQLLDAFMSGDADQVVADLNKVFNAINYERYPIQNEAALQACLQLLFIGMKLSPRVEVHSAHGRSDIELLAKDFYWVLELKFSRSGIDANALCLHAVEQILEKRYGETPHQKPLVRLALVFDGTSRQITAWKKI